MARPITMTDEMTTAICASIAEVGFFATACEVNGVSRRTGAEWLAKGEGPDAVEPYKGFRVAVKTAQALYCHGQIKALSDPRWKLERLDPDQFAPPKHEVVLTGTLDVSARSDAELEAIIAGKVLP